MELPPHQIVRYVKREKYLNIPSPVIAPTMPSFSKIPAGYGYFMLLILLILATLYEFV